MNNDRSVSAVVWVLVVGGVLGLWLWLAPYFWTNVLWGVRSALFVLVPLAVLAVVVIGLAVLDEERGWSGAGCLATLIGIGGLAALGFWAFGYHSYAQARDYASSVHVVDQQVPELGQRAPFPVAQAQARPNLGDAPGDLVNGTYQPQHDEFTSLVERRGWFSGYQVALTQNIPLTGRGTGRTCEFAAEADRRIGGWWWHNLGRLIGSQQRGVLYDAADVYGYCDGDTPKVVVPLVRQVGWLVVTERPAGVAVYDGKTGAVTFQDTAKGLPGNSYPLSLAKAQRESTHALGGFWDWVWNRAGWDTDEDETNSANNAEFALPTKDNRTVYTTLLTGRGSATSISALSTVTTEAQGTELAPLTVHRLNPSWVSPGAIDSRIKADYQDLPNWQNYKVLEVAPISGDRWVASIGNDQNLLYRVQGTGNLQGDQATCLYRADNSLIRCGSVADQNGNSVGTEYGTGQPDAGIPTDLGQLTDQQLADLQRRVSEEIGRRLTGTG
ncbi:hypothetical protein MOQ72_01340 [Saccharopolyspora sp. K220]|uniref:hypothetical protein n=1 Tax=Saccharopolyspora soli TaxID=2926618 RepID=UPI001F56A346|nr:hypothetical protein [Saccharopolyspora soli]MCI2416054.1 hypothetical protein [Saccharopolyspora soli]